MKAINKTTVTPKEAQMKFANSFNHFAYRFGQSEVFIDFLDYVLLVLKWQDQNRDFTYFENKYKEDYSRFPEMLELLSIASNDFHDALGDLFMELVSFGRNGQFFTPENICSMIASTNGMSNLENDKRILDPACGSSRMLLAAAKFNRHVNLYGCDNDITCCKMSVINLVLNSLKGEIALMNSIEMSYTKSWKINFKNIHGMNIPFYLEIDNKDESDLWKLHINSFSANKKAIKSKRDNSNKEIKLIQLELFD